MKQEMCILKLAKLKGFERATEEQKEAMTMRNKMISNKTCNDKNSRMSCKKCCKCVYCMRARNIYTFHIKKQQQHQHHFVICDTAN